MSKNKTPSLVALLGLLAVAGYQNRDKLGDMIRNNKPDVGPNEGPGQIRDSSSFFDEIGSLFAGATGGASLSEAMTGLVDRFRGAGHTKTADSWMASGSNHEIKTDELASCLGEDMVQELAAKTGFSRDEILSRLARTLPEAVDCMTPDGRVPSATEAHAHI